MEDPTEEIRRKAVAEINAEVASNDELQERARLEKIYDGGVWDSAELREQFEVVGFAAPFVVAKRKADGKKGSLMFQHSPRFYFQWMEEEGG
jgi:hypothetical protein